MRKERVNISTPELDREEMMWWDVNADSIEKIWALNFELQKIIRLPYLKKMKHFFLRDAKHSPVSILEIGCGSGWVCRLVAGDDFHVLGTDFSEGQLNIAREQAKVYNKEKFCTYKLADASSFESEVDGIVIHALLHHLSNEELIKFFSQLSKIKRGTKVFMYEPLFPERQGAQPSIKDKILNRLITKIKGFTIRRAKDQGSPDVELSAAMEKIYEQAENNGWYISPKEVPFYEKELDQYLSADFNLIKKYYVNRSDLEVSQALILNKIYKPDYLFSKILIPVLIWLDKLASKGNFTFYTSPLTHQFVCFELVRR